ncbi:MAG: cellobiose phosphorylase [Lachnospiraceae bacterium]|nr:cellobiose phosphorylase [Lachnospiraceae bacterium]
MEKITFLGKDGTFQIRNPENYSGLYFPLAGEKGLKSSITPNLGGDSKLDQNHFLLEPVSIENLHNNRNTRNFWCRIEGKGCWSACGTSAEQEAAKFTDAQDESMIEAGFMWQKLVRTSEKYGLTSEITSFVPVNDNVEVTMVKLQNSGKEQITVTPVGIIPIYGRSADNIRDHRHVTSLLHRIEVKKYGVEVIPVLSFDERGHQQNHTAYYVYGSTAEGEAPAGFYPTVESFIGEGGSYLNPEAVRKSEKGRRAGTLIQGKEAAGGMCFEKITLKPQESAAYILIAGVTDNKAEIEKTAEKYRTGKQVEEALEQLKIYWQKQVNVYFETGDGNVDNYLKWISFQPELRRIYGCSFLPYHDYGKGGRGWRDLWQDCLALLIMNPSGVRQMILSNYGGVRMDGTNATIIGSGQGEFIADRNNITRVWMDHAFWPFVTTKLYIDQTGDIGILLEKAAYFKDMQVKRGEARDLAWNETSGNLMRTSKGEAYYGSILEHILIENLCAFYDVGEHNEMRLHGADWNDALDMAWERGESVAFTCAYAGNLRDIAAYIRVLSQKCGVEKLELAEEIQYLLAKGRGVYEFVDEKESILSAYENSCLHTISGEKIVVSAEELCQNLEEKAEWMMLNIRQNEWIEENDGNGWFNGYYDNHGRQVEGIKNGKVHMMLTGQVFSIMSGTAEKDQIKKIISSVDKYLFDEQIGGCRLNTDFEEEKFDLGRMFGFAYGEKENGAVFSHMAVMYANALYKRGHAREGYRVLKALLDAARNIDSSKMYPGLPEYFNNDGRGLYAYLTGAASWYMMTMVAEVFGVKGEIGDMIIAPALQPEQFDEQGNAAIGLEFAGRKFHIAFRNPKKLNCGQQSVLYAHCDGIELPVEVSGRIRLSKEQISELDTDTWHRIEVIISK